MLNGNPGTSMLNVDDTGNPNATIGTLTASTLTGLGMASGITYTGMQFINIALGSGTNTFNVQGTSAATDIDTGAGNNSLVMVGSLAPTLGGTLNNILGNLTVGSLTGQTALVLDDSGDTTPRIGTFSGNQITGLTASGAVIGYGPGVSSLTINAGAGAGFNLDGSPAGLTSATFNNSTTTRDALYATNWTTPLTVNGDFDLDFGQLLLPGWTVNPVDSLQQLAIPVTFNFSTTSSTATQVLLEGDLDPVGANYSINGTGNLVIANQTVGLTVTINGFRNQDLAWVKLPGGTVNANLTATGPGSIEVDGSVRQTGINARAANNITVSNGVGNVTMQAIGPDTSELDMFNTVVVQGSLPQDSLTLNVPSVFHLAPTQAAFYGPSFYTAPTLPPGYLAFVDNLGHGGGVSLPPILASSFSEDRTQLIDYTDTTLTLSPPPGSPVLTDDPVREFPVETSPVAPNNNLNLDASALLGQFNVNVSNPDYVYAAQLSGSNGGDGFLDWTRTAIAFTQTAISLSAVNPQLAVSITGTNPSLPSTLNYGSLIPWQGTSFATPYSNTTLDIGAGQLANIQGNVSVHSVQLTVDDGQGTSANTLTLAGTNLGLATSSGATPTVSFDSTLYGATAGAAAFTITGSTNSGDQLNITNTSGVGSSGLDVTGHVNLNLGNAAAPSPITFSTTSVNVNIVGNVTAVVPITIAGGTQNITGNVTANAANATISVSGGTLNVFGNVAATAAITLGGGTLNVTGTLSDTSPVGLAGGTLANATITTGTVVQAIFNSSGTNTKTLQDVTLAGTLNFLQQYGAVNVAGNGLTLMATQGVANSGTINDLVSGFLDFSGNQSLSGTGTVNLASSDAFTPAAINLGGTGSTLTIGQNITIQGTDCAINAGSSTIDNFGTINANSAGFNPFTLSAASGGTWINDTTGILEATNKGTLNLGAIANSGTISTSGGTVNVSGAWTNTGIIEATNGTLSITSNGTNSGTINAAGGTISVQSETNFANGILTGGTWEATAGGILRCSAPTSAPMPPPSC